MDLNLNFDAKDLTEKYDVEDLAKNAVDFASANGILLQSRKSRGDVEHAPLMLFPTPFPKKLYDQAKEVQHDFNLLIHKVSQDHEFLKESLQSAIQVDEFTSRIYDIFEQTRKEGIAQPISLGVLRLDYMLQKTSDRGTAESMKECSIKQVEINTISVGAYCFASKLPELYSYVFGLLDKDVPVGSPQLPSNLVVNEIGEGLAQAWEYYGSKSAVILMITADHDVMLFDQRQVEYYLHQRSPRIKLIRRSLTKMYETASLDSRKLMVDGYEVAVAYYRSGYTPRDYPTQDAWAARLLIERSLAIKSPTAALHLVGTKKVQQVLAEPGVLERFLTDEDAVRRIRNTFTGQYSLDEGPQGDRNIKMALQDPDKYVLKPQREGGGNNIFGDEITTTLNEIKDSNERTQYILMDKICPPSLANYIIPREHGRPVIADVVSELGIHGVYISLGDKVLVNRQAGNLFRTKSIEHQGSGLVAGRANLDYPYLF